VSTDLYLGAPGSGKSYLMREHVRSLAEEPGVVILVCDHGEKAGEPGWSSIPGARSYTTIAQFWREPSRVAVFQSVSAVDVAQCAIDVGWSVYVDDEVDGLVTEGNWKVNPLREIVKRGRHLPNKAGQITSVSAMVATHRPANLPTDLSGLFSRVYIGRLYAYNDADRVYREGWVAERNVTDVQARLNSLELGEFEWWPKE
jgi:hypothetical protein